MKRKNYTMIELMICLVAGFILLVVIGVFCLIGCGIYYGVGAVKTVQKEGVKNVAERVWNGPEQETTTDSQIK